jgi:hypothetical protein
MSVPICPRTGEVQLLFEHGALLPDSEGLLHGEGTQTRTLQVTSTSPRSYEARNRNALAAGCRAAVAVR